MNTSICKETVIDESKLLIDQRDGKSYWVTKLADKNCWMTQNLALDLYGADNFTNQNTDITVEKWEEAKGVQSMLWTTGSGIDYNLIAWYASPTNQDIGHASYGNYYSWQAATAGTGSKVATYPGNASGSICPKGWRLPSSNSTTDNGSFGKLTTIYNIGSNAAGFSRIQTYPLYFVPGGFVNVGKLDNVSTYGFYWSSTASDASHAYALNFNSNNAGPSTNYFRYHGMFVRCLVLGS